MQNLLQGNYSVVDIGLLKTKIITVKSTKLEVKVTHSDIFDTPSEFIGDGVLKDFRKLGDFIKECLAEMSVKTKRVVIISDYLEIAYNITEYTREDSDNVDLLFNSDSGGKRYPSNIKVGSFRLFGQYDTESDTKYVVGISTGKINLLSALYRDFKESGLEILSISNQDAAEMSISKLIPSKYEDPYKLFVHLGNRLKVYVTQMGRPLSIEVSDTYSTHTDLKYLADTLDTTEEKVMYAIEEVGCVRSAISYTALYELGIANPEQYFDEVEKVLKDVVTLMDQRISEAIEQHDLSNDIEIFGLGGMMETQGLREMSNYRIKVFNVSENLFSDRFSVINQSKTDSELTPVFSTCVGEILNPCFQHNTNLLPKEKLSKSVDNKLIVTSKVCSLVLIFLLMTNTISLSVNLYHYINMYGVEESLSQLQKDTASLKSKSSKLDSYLEAADASSSYLSQLIKFVDEYNDSIITVASIDTEALVAPVKETKEETTPEQPNAQTLNQTLGVGKENLILRGYSTSTAAISQLYEDVQQFDFLESCNLNNIEQQILPSLETIYTFEISLVMGG